MSAALYANTDDGSETAGATADASDAGAAAAEDDAIDAEFEVKD